MSLDLFSPTDVEEGELEDDELQLPLEMDGQLHSVAGAEHPPSEPNINPSGPGSKGIKSLLELDLLRGAEHNAEGGGANNAIPSTEEEEYLNRRVSEPAADKQSDEYQLSLQQLGLPSVFRGAGRGDRGMRRPFRARGFSNGYRNFKGKQPFGYRRTPPVPSFQPIPFPPPKIGESIRRQRSYSRDKSISPDRSHKRRRSRSRSPRRSSRRSKGSRSGKHSRRHRHSESGDYSDRSRSRSRSRRHRKKTRRSRSRSSERVELTDLRKRWLTSSTRKKHSPKIVKQDQNGFSSSSSSSTSDSEEERKKLVRRRVAKLIERCRLENRLQNAAGLPTDSDQLQAPPPPTLTPEPAQFQPPNSHIQQEEVAEEFYIRPSIPAATIIVPKTEANTESQQYKVDSRPTITKPKSATKELVPVDVKSLRRSPHTPPTEPPKTPDRPIPSKVEVPSPFVLKEVINHSMSEREEPQRKKRIKKPRTPPPPPAEPYPEGASSEDRKSKDDHLPAFDENTVVTPSDGPLGMLLIGLTRCCVKSEEDAQIALFVASSLTRGLADYHSREIHAANNSESDRVESAQNGENDQPADSEKKEDSLFYDLMCRSLPHLKDFQETYGRVKGTENMSSELSKQSDDIVRIHDEISTMFNAEETNECVQASGDKSDSNKNILGSESPSSSACLLELPDETELRTKIPHKLEIPKSQIDPSAIRSRASAVWEPMFTGNNP